MGDFTFSEHGEDILIHRLLLWKSNGFYIDCGAYHPRKMSMTARLRLYGWRGINIDADSRVIDVFNEQTHGLINLNAAISSKQGRVHLRRYSDPVINTVSPEQIKHLDDIDERGGLLTGRLDTVQVEAKMLSQILLESDVSAVDYMNIDIEGAEQDAIVGYDWDRCSPTVVSCEIHKLNLYNPAENVLVALLNDHGYRLQSYVFHTAIFVRKDFDVEDCHRVPFETL